MNFEDALGYLLGDAVANALQSPTRE